MPQNEDGEDQKVEENNEETVLKVYMHCEGCAKKVSSCLQGFDGVEEVEIDRKNNKVIVRGEEAEPVKVFERIRKKYSRNVELVSPKPKPDGGQDKKEPQNNKPQSLVKVIVILKMYMHCEGCARDIKKNIARIKGVSSVEPDMSKSQVRVKGVFDPKKLAETIIKRLGKHVEIVKQETAAAKKENNNKRNEGDKEENVIYYSTQYPFYSHCQIFSDENAYSCLIM